MNIFPCIILFSLIQGNETFPCYIVTIRCYREKYQITLDEREMVFSISKFPCYSEIMTLVPDTIFF
jgi:hypothetical protein